MKIWKQKKKLFVSFGMVLLVTFLVWYTERKETIMTENGQLLRQENEEYEAKLLYEVDGTEKREISINVPTRYLTEAEEAAYIKAAIDEIEKEFVGENLSLAKVQGEVKLRSNYQDGKVLAEWEFSNYRLFEEDGTIIENNLQGECEDVEARVSLTCEDSSLIYEFYFTVYKREKNEEELFYEKLNQLISENGEREGTEFLWLPTELEGHSLVWTEPESGLPLQVFCIGMLIVVLLPMVEKEREKEVQKKREAQLLREYPEMVNKVTLLLGAGMTLTRAWQQITVRYVEDREKKRIPKREAYEEMLITQREIENGKGEEKAFEAFGERCGLQKYRKFSSYLIQNMKKGNRGLCELLEREAAEAFAERKSMAQKYGEEAGTKLLLPMLLMLGVVIFVIMVPAVISFQSGTN